MSASDTYCPTASVPSLWGMSKSKQVVGGSGCKRFGDKFAQWLTSARTTINAFSKTSGLPQRTLHAWVREGVKPSASGLAVIERLTGIPAGYWINDDLPWPPAARYGKREERWKRAGDSLDDDTLTTLLPVLEQPDAAKRLAEIWRAVQGRAPDRTR